MESADSQGNAMGKWIALLLFAASHVANGAEVTIRADVWYPHNGTPGSATPGYMIEIAQAAFAAKGINVNYDAMPWERALTLTREGKIDCVVGASPDDAPDFVYPTEPQGRNQNVFYVRQGNAWRFSDMASLANVKLGVIEGYAYADELDAYIEANKGTPKIQAVTGDTPLDQNIKKLLAGRVDVIVESAPVLQAKLKEMNLEGKLDAAGDAGEADDLFIACSPKLPAAPEYARILTEGTQTLRQSGELKKILNKYGLSDWK